MWESVIPHAYRDDKTKWLEAHANGVCPIHLYPTTHLVPIDAPRCYASIGFPLHLYMARDDPWDRDVMLDKYDKLVAHEKTVQEHCLQQLNSADRPRASERSTRAPLPPTETGGHRLAPNTPLLVPPT